MTLENSDDRSRDRKAFDSVKSQNDRLGALASIAARIGIYRDTRRLAREAVQAIADLLPIDEVLLLLIDKDTNSLVFHEGFSLLTDDVGRYKRETIWDDSMAGEVVRRREPILIEEASISGRARDYAEGIMSHEMVHKITPSPAHYPEASVSLGWIPLMTPEKVIGVLSVTTSAPHKLNQTDMEFLLTLGSQLGVYLENARLLEELTRSNKQLIRQNQDLEELLSVISHDLRSPLATIGGYASLLMKKGEKLDPDERIQFAEMIFGKTKETSRRFDDLLAVFRTDAGRDTEEPSAVDITSVIEEALVEADQEKRLAQFTVDLPDHLPRLLGHATHLMHIFTNLFSNAIKFMGSQEAPRITVTYERVTEGVEVHHRFSIADNGMGIPADYIGSVFRLFTRVPTEEDIPGTGIGLASVQRIIRSLGGTIDIESREGEGTTVSFTLPWEEVEESSEIKDQSSE